MAQSQVILSVTKITDDETGMYNIGEVDFSIHVHELESFLKQYGYNGKSAILSTLGHLCYQVETYFRAIPDDSNVANEANEKF